MPDAFPVAQPTVHALKGKDHHEQAQKSTTKVLLMATFQNNVGKLVPDCQTVLYFAKTRDDGRIGGNN